MWPRLSQKCYACILEGLEGMEKVGARRDPPEGPSQKSVGRPSQEIFSPLGHYKEVGKNAPRKM